jgi:hypothetical protein
MTETFDRAIARLMDGEKEEKIPLTSVEVGSRVVHPV